MAITNKEQAEYQHWQPEFTKEIDGKLVRFRDVCVHEFTLGDVEDPEIYAAGPIIEWQETDAGQWIIEHAVEQPYYIRAMDHMTWGYKYRIMARLSEQDQTFWTLKWAGNKK